MASSSLFDRQIMADTSERRRRRDIENKSSEKKDECAKYTPLLKAVLKGDWETAKRFFEQDPKKKDRGWFPVHYAAINAKKETLSYLLKVTYEDDAATSMLFFHSGTEPAGAELLIHVITSGFFDIALDLVHRYPQLALHHAPNDYDCGLEAIARKVDAFPSGTHLNFWERLIYGHIPVKLENYARDPCRVQIENPVDNSQMPARKYHLARFLGKFSISVGKKLQATLWIVIALLAPHVKNIREQKQMHHQALQLVRQLIKEMMTLNDLNEYDSLATDAIVNATRLGIHEVVEEIVESVPKLVWAKDLEEHRSLFQRAVLERHENVFNLIYQMTDHKLSVTTDIDEEGNNILHLAGRLAPLNKLNLVSGAALQMQRELQWYNAVKQFVRPSYLEKQNKDKETPAMVFTRAHKDLVVAGGDWMRNTANSCTISAALIATVVFASIITVPGGSTDSNGLPIFAKEWAFIVFVTTDALSLFTSTTSLLLFLSILTSRYAEGDFLDVLPKRLIIGLVTLFLSITTMMVAFSCSLYLVLGHKEAWILVPVAALACLPVTAFVSLQFPLLVDLITSTYGHGIFGKKSDRQFY